MPVPQFSRRVLRAFIAAQHRRGVNRRPIEIFPRLFFHTWFSRSYKSAVKSQL
jgi:hypothetical protein